MQTFQIIYLFFYISNEPATIDINIIKFKDALTDVQWNDVNACYESLISKFSGLNDKYFPKQRKRVIARNRNKNWIA